MVEPSNEQGTPLIPLHSTQAEVSLDTMSDGGGSGGARNYKPRKPYTITKPRERWTDEEHARFLDGMNKYGRSWARVAQHVGSKSTVQIRSHAQKYFNRLKRFQNMQNTASATQQATSLRALHEWCHTTSGAAEDASAGPSACPSSYPCTSSGQPFSANAASGPAATAGSEPSAEPSSSEAFKRAVDIVAAAATEAATAAASVVVAAAGQQIKAQLDGMFAASHGGVDGGFTCANGQMPHYTQDPTLAQCLQEAAAGAQFANFVSAAATAPGVAPSVSNAMQHGSAVEHAGHSGASVRACNPGMPQSVEAAIALHAVQRLSALFMGPGVPGGMRPGCTDNVSHGFSAFCASSHGLPAAHPIDGAAMHMLPFLSEDVRSSLPWLCGTGGDNPSTTVANTGGTHAGAEGYQHVAFDRAATRSQQVHAPVVAPAMPPPRHGTLDILVETRNTGDANCYSDSEVDVGAPSSPAAQDPAEGSGLLGHGATQEEAMGNPPGRAVAHTAGTSPLTSSGCGTMRGATATAGDPRKEARLGLAKHAQRDDSSSSHTEEPGPPGGGSPVALGEHQHCECNSRILAPPSDRSGGASLPKDPNAMTHSGAGSNVLAGNGGTQGRAAVLPSGGLLASRTRAVTQGGTPQSNASTLCSAKRKPSAFRRGNHTKNINSHASSRGDGSSGAGGSGRDGDTGGDASGPGATITTLGGSGSSMMASNTHASSLLHGTSGARGQSHFASACAPCGRSGNCTNGGHGGTGAGGSSDEAGNGGAQSVLHARRDDVAVAHVRGAAAPAEHMGCGGSSAAFSLLPVLGSSRTSGGSGSGAFSVLHPQSSSRERCDAPGSKKRSSSQPTRSEEPVKAARSATPGLGAHGTPVPPYSAGAGADACASAAAPLLAHEADAGTGAGTWPTQLDPSDMTRHLQRLLGPVATAAAQRGGSSANELPPHGCLPEVQPLLRPPAPGAAEAPTGATWPLGYNGLPQGATAALCGYPGWMWPAFADPAQLACMPQVLQMLAGQQGQGQATSCLLGQPMQPQQAADGGGGGGGDKRHDQM